MNIIGILLNLTRFFQIKMEKRVLLEILEKFVKFLPNLKEKVELKRFLRCFGEILKTMHTTNTLKSVLGL